MSDSLEIYARVNDSEWADWTKKMVNVAVDSTIASRLTYMDFSEETRQRFTDIAEAMLSLNAGSMAGAQGYWRFGAVPRAVPVVWNSIHVLQHWLHMTLVVATIFYSTRHRYDVSRIVLRDR